MRDDLPQMPMTAQAKRYTRRGGLAAMRPGVGQKAYVKMTADLVNQGKTAGFPSRDVAKATAGSRLEAASPLQSRRVAGHARLLVQALIARGQHG